MSERQVDQETIAIVQLPKDECTNRLTYPGCPGKEAVKRV